MWKDYTELNIIPKSIAGRDGLEPGVYKPYYVRYNESAETGTGLEYSTEEPERPPYPPELFQTSAGEIDLYDEGELGGHLEIGGRFICDGNFCDIFEFKGEKYVVDSLRYTCCRTFRLHKVNDDGTVEELYNADEFAAEHQAFARDSRTDASGTAANGTAASGTAASGTAASGTAASGIAANETGTEGSKTGRIDSEDCVKKYKLSMQCWVGLDAYYICDQTALELYGEKSVFFLCSGEIVDTDRTGDDRFTKVHYLLAYDPEHIENPLIRIDLPEDIEFEYVTSIWTDGVWLAIGCDKEVVIVYLPDMEFEYRSEAASDIE